MATLLPEPSPAPQPEHGRRPAAEGPGARGRRVRQAIGTFRDVDRLRSVMDDLVTSGFAAQDITLLAGQRTLEQGFGYRLTQTGESASGNRFFCGPPAAPSTPAHAPLPTCFIELGTNGQVGTLLASLSGWMQQLHGSGQPTKGGGLADVLRHSLGLTQADYLAQQLEAGALTLWIRVHDGAEETRACKFLLRHSVDQVQVHDVLTPGLARTG